MPNAFIATLEWQMQPLHIVLGLSLLVILNRGHAQAQVRYDWSVHRFRQPPGVLEVDPGRELAGVAKAAGDIKQKYKEDPQMKKITAQLAADATFLQATWLTSRAGKVPTSYWEVLWFDAQVLRHILDDDMIPGPERKPVISEIALDLRVKATYCRWRGLQGEGLGKPIALTVKTVRGGREVSNLYVRANPIRFPKALPLIVFSKPSSPTTNYAVAAGYYLMWVEDPTTGKTSTPQPVIVGEDGKDTAQLTLAVDR
jgi:hypothetical protein